MEAADNGGAFVDYVDGELKTSYVTKLVTAVDSPPFVKLLLRVRCPR